MGTLEDQLKKWKKQQPTEAGSGKVPAGPGPSEPTRRRSTKKDPFPAQTLRRDEPASPAVAAPAPPVSDAALFSRAVDAVDRDVVLQKFDAGLPATGTPRGARSAPPAPPPTDEELFRSFVGDARPAKSSSTPSSSANLGPPGEPDARLSLKGATGDVAARRLRAFLDDAVRAGAACVLVQIDAGADDVVDVARTHPAVATVRDAPSRLGGKHARLIRLKT
jgi:hypothetical protein